MDRRAYHREYNRRRRLGLQPERSLLFVQSHIPPDPETLAERDRAMAAPQTLTAIVAGDPLPGRSALDRRSSCR